MAGMNLTMLKASVQTPEAMPSTTTGTLSALGTRYGQATSFPKSRPGDMDRTMTPITVYVAMHESADRRRAGSIKRQAFQNTIASPAGPTGAFIAAVKTLAINIAIDEFDTGYSNMCHIANHPA